MASWVSVQLDTTPPALDVDIPDADPGDTLVVPFTLSDGTITGQVTLPDTTTVDGTVVGSTMEFDLPPGVFGHATIVFTATDDVLNSIQVSDDLPIFSDVPSPVTHHPLDLILLSGRNSSVVVSEFTHDVSVIDNNTGSIVDETISDAILNETDTGVEVTEPVHTAEIDEITHGIVVLEVSGESVVDETDTGIEVDPTATNAVVEESFRGVVLLDEGHLTSVLTTISEKTVVEIQQTTDVALIENSTAVIVNETPTGVIEL